MCHGKVVTERPPYLLIVSLHMCWRRLLSRRFVLPSLSLSFDPNVKPVLLSLNGRGFYVLRYTAIPEQTLARVSFELADPNTGEGGSAEALVDPRLVEALNSHNAKPVTEKALLIWIDTSKGEVSWQFRTWQDPAARMFKPGPG